MIEKEEEMKKKKTKKKRRIKRIAHDLSCN